MTKPTIWVPTRSDTNQPVQSQKIARSLKFGMNEEEKLYYPYSENKGADQLRSNADQLRSYCEADLRLCFRLCILLVFPCSGSNNINQETTHMLNVWKHIYLYLSISMHINNQAL